MKASDWILQREVHARREGSIVGAIAGVVIGLGVMLAIHLALSMHADNVHARALATIREADALLMSECKALVVDLAEEEYETVVAYRRQIDELQGRK